MKTNTTLYSRNLAGDPEAPRSYPDGEPSIQWRKRKLLDYAADMGVEGVDSSNTKSQILAAINSAT